MALRPAPLPSLWLTALLVGCAAGESEPRDSVVVAPSQQRAPARVDASSAAPTLSAERRAALERAADDVVRFLAGDVRFETLALADTVELHLAPEGAGTSGGVSVRLGRDALRDREAWTIDAGGRAFSFVPAARLAKRTVRAGTHFNCREVPLATRAPALARRPHVGVRLEPAEPKSCLETWNATFVFDTNAARPRLVAALYDQWEW
jgi:hypothetical protein